MSRNVAFLRAINVGGHTVTMEELRRLFGALGFKDVETFIASGNVIFSSGSKGGAGLGRRIEVRLHKALGYEVRTFVRTGAEVAAVARYQPFKGPKLRDSRTFCVGFLAEPLDAAQTKALLALRSDIDDLHPNGREIYWVSRLGQSDSVISNAVLEKALKVRFTFRGVNTIVRLVAKYDFAPGAA